MAVLPCSGGIKPFNLHILWGFRDGQALLGVLGTRARGRISAGA